MAKSRTKSQSDLWNGAFWCVGGLALTIGTYVLADDMGGGYLVAWGPVVYGLYLFIKGSIGVLSGDSELDPASIEQETTTSVGKCPSCKSTNDIHRKYCKTCGRALTA